MSKELLSALAIILTFAASLPYIRSIHRGLTKPHVFSWVIWGLATLIVFCAQLADHGGVGAWPIGISGVLTSYTALLAYLKRGAATITRIDWAFLVVALAALPLWFVTADPLWAVVILTIVDLTGFGPTLRAAYVRPHEERTGLFLIIAARNLLAILALEHYSLTTMLFPAGVGIGCLGLVAVIAYRRISLAGKHEQNA